MNNKTILIAGGSGLIGKRLTELMINLGWHIHKLSRKNRPSTNHVSYFLWDLNSMTIDDKATKVDAIINLTGAGIADARWTKKRKEILVSSRQKSALLLGESLKRQNHKPVYVSASAVGYYGDRGDTELTEFHEPGTSFLAECCQLWEAAAISLEKVVDRLVINRIGIVLSTKGGALPKILMTKPVLSYFGDGQQYYPWIHIDDVCQIFIDSVTDNKKIGIYNACVPQPLTNKVFTKKIKEVIGGIVIPAPAFALRLAMGEMSQIVLDSSRVIPKRLKEEGFTWKFSELKSAVKDLVENDK